MVRFHVIYCVFVNFSAAFVFNIFVDHPLINYCDFLTTWIFIPNKIWWFCSRFDFFLQKLLYLVLVILFIKFSSIILIKFSEIYLSAVFLFIFSYSFHVFFFSWLPIFIYHMIIIWLFPCDYSIFSMWLFKVITWYLLWYFRFYPCDIFVIITVISSWLSLLFPRNYHFSGYFHGFSAPDFI